MRRREAVVRPACFNKDAEYARQFAAVIDLKFFS